MLMAASASNTLLTLAQFGTDNLFHLDYEKKLAVMKRNRSEAFNTASNPFLYMTFSGHQHAMLPR